MKVQFSTIGKTVSLSAELAALSPRDQADMCCELLEITGVKAIMLKHGKRGEENYQSVVNDIWEKLTEHWSKK